MKLSYKLLLSFYLAVLLWLVLFKFSFDVVTVIEYHQTRTLNLIPFAGLSHTTVREMIENVVVFVPLGLLFGIASRPKKLWQKLGIISAVSLGVEIIQFIFGIGITDITDLITNTLGGFIGLGLYTLSAKHINSEVLNRCIASILIVIVAAILFLRIFVLKVRY